ncbi:hypothetical protein B0W48_16440 [Pseudoalteromonas aliena]|uniref:Uncharacterized protein n=1 Tax=Pseudoalteromonas aliena TaxID=247523 RepID=A0A1Q2H1R7_9GAMM|nr:hypothetical protein B0W48_16440 [Pseudoalteromonas aliena]
MNQNDFTNLILIQKVIALGYFLLIITFIGLREIINSLYLSYTPTMRAITAFKSIKYKIIRGPNGIYE